MRSKKFPDTAPTSDYAAGVPLAAGHGFPSLDAGNPIVFLDISTTTSGMGGHNHRPKETRLFIELLANVNPLLARNFYAFCTGEFTRVVAGRDAPCGYKDSFFFDAEPGRSLTGGDVITKNGASNVSSLQVPGAAKLSIPPLITKLPSAATSCCCGWVYAVATAAGTAGSQFRMTFPGDVLPQDLSGVIGRMVVRAGPAALDDVAAVLAVLQECTKHVWSAQRGAAHAAYPAVVLCGEM